MDSYLDTWMSGTSQLSKSITRETNNSTSTSNIIGKKLNSYININSGLQENHPRIIEHYQNSSSRSRLKSSKSPARSVSHRSVKSRKNLEKSSKKIDSPARQRFKQTSTKKSSEKLQHTRRSPINDCSNLILREKSETQRKTAEEQDRKSAAKSKLEKINKKIRENNSKSYKRGLKTTNKKSNIEKPEKMGGKCSRENNGILYKPSEKDCLKLEDRKIVDQDLASTMKERKTSPSVPEKLNKKKSPTRETRKNPKIKKKTQKDLEETLEKNSKKNMKAQKFVKNPEELSFSLLNLTKNKKKRARTLRKKQNYRISSDRLSEKLKNIQKRVYSKYDNLKIEAAKKIQDWFRGILYSKNKKKQENGLVRQEWVSFVNTSYQENTRLKKYNEQYIDSLASNTQETFFQKSSTSSFQLKRPKELVIDQLCSPFVQELQDMKSSSGLLKPGENWNMKSPTFNKSISENASVEIIVSSLDDPSDEIITSSSASIQSNPKDLSIKSFSVNNINLSEVSNKDSLEKDITELSLALIAESLANENMQLTENSFKATVDQKEDTKDPPIFQPLGLKSIESNIIISPKSTVINENSSESIIKSAGSNLTSIPSPDISYSLSDIIQELAENEINLFISSIKFQAKPKEVDPDPSYLNIFLKSLFEEMEKNEEEFLELVNTPAFIDPLAKLNILQYTDVGELPKRPNLEIILPSEIGNVVRSKLSGGVKSKEIYLQMIFDCVNEALNYTRPFGLRGVPDPWVSEPRLLFGEGELSRVCKAVKRVLEEWINIKGGIFLEKTQEFDDEILQNAREERMSKILCFDVNSEEEFWVDYLDEETQSKMDMADLILDMLLKETVDLV